MTPGGGRRSGVVWARVEEDFHVATQRGVFLGYIDRQAGDFFAYDERPHFIGRFPTLPLAMTAVLDERATALPETVPHAAVARAAGGWTRKAADG